MTERSQSAPESELAYARDLLKRLRDNCCEIWEEASFVEVRKETDDYFLGFKGPFASSDTAAQDEIAFLRSELKFIAESTTPIGDNLRSLARHALKNAASHGPRPEGQMVGLPPALGGASSPNRADGK